MAYAITIKRIAVKAAMKTASAAKRPIAGQPSSVRPHKDVFAPMAAIATSMHQRDASDRLAETEADTNSRELKMTRTENSFLRSLLSMCRKHLRVDA